MDSTRRYYESLDRTDILTEMQLHILLAPIELQIRYFWIYFSESTSTIMSMRIIELTLFMKWITLYIIYVALHIFTMSGY